MKMQRDLRSRVSFRARRASIVHAHAQPLVQSVAGKSLERAAETSGNG